MQQQQQQQQQPQSGSSAQVFFRNAQVCTVFQSLRYHYSSHNLPVFLSDASHLHVQLISVVTSMIVIHVKCNSDVHPVS